MSVRVNPDSPDVPEAVGKLRRRLICHISISASWASFPERLNWKLVGSFGSPPPRSPCTRT
eukprot:4090457-Karenia_brevis.AAC.1